MNDIQEGMQPNDGLKDIEHYEEDVEEHMHLPSGAAQNRLTLDDDEMASFVDTTNIFPNTAKAAFMTVSPKTRRNRPTWISNHNISPSKGNRFYHT